MPLSALYEPLPLARGPALKNRFVLAPLTNLQSHADGRLSDEEFRWLTMRAKGGFGLTMTCASHVQPVGQGFPGQLGAWSDAHVEGLTRLAAEIRSYRSVSSVQLHHAGMRADKGLVPIPVSSSEDAETGARALTTEEVEELVDAFVQGAVRAERAGFDGVELHGAHGYVLAQFLSPEVNRRTDRYGGSLENRARIYFEIIDGVRRRCRADFQLGVRLSPERFGMQLPEVIEVASAMMAGGQVDYLDMSLWDVFKAPEDPAFNGRSLLGCFAELRRGNCRLGVAGKVTTGAAGARALEEGADFVIVGRAAILHHDFPERARALDWAPVGTPVSSAYAEREGVSAAFREYLRGTFRLVEPEPA